jgi:CheY-like chemotaxis protein
LDKYNHSKFDIIVTDINMPNMNGVELIEKITSINPEQLIIVLSNINDVDYFIKLLNLGVDGFLIKPFGFRKLAKKIIQSLESLYYKKLIFDLKKEKIIAEYKHKQKIEELKQTAINEKEEDVKRKEKFEDILTKHGQMVTDRLSAKEFFDIIKNDPKYNEKLEIVIQNIKALINCINQLLIIAENLYYNLDSERAEKLIRDLSKAFLETFHAIESFEIIKDVAEPFYLFFDFFDDYQYIDSLHKDEVKELLSIEFIAKDLNNFLNEVFISKTAENIFLYDDLFMQSLEQLESNLQSICRDLDDGELEFF